jgi:N-acetylglucosaminyl-diphospho-decaprenol L-rhamnosyltransferase
MEEQMSGHTHTKKKCDVDLEVGVVYTYEDNFMPRLLSSLHQSGGDLNTRLLLVDNLSERGAEQWETHFPETTVIHNSQRLLYAANLNRILQASTAPYVLLLNTDMYFDPPQRCLAKMVRFMREHPSCGIAGCRLYHEDGQFAYPARRFQNVSTILARRLGLGKMLGSTLDRYLYREHSPEDVFECDWLSGCFMMVRREAMAEVGLFDSGFVKYFEDVDMCLRMGRAGWKVMYNGQTHGHHLEERSSRNILSVDARRHARSYLRWLRKWGMAPRVSGGRPQRENRAA